MIISVHLHPKAGEMSIEEAPDCGRGIHARLRLGKTSNDATIYLEHAQVAELQRLCAEYLEARREVPMFASRVER